ncbi:MAG: Twitching motility protein PilT [Labilithrix sp.]|nr:Twitching motility protein PilT [Labilithrix sp.]
MSSLSQLFAVFERIPCEELRLTTGENPFVMLNDGAKKPIGTSPMTAQHILAAAGEVLSDEEIEALPTSRPRVVRHEADGESWVIEVSRARSGLSLSVRRARGVVARMDRRTVALAVDDLELEEVVELRTAGGGGRSTSYRSPPNASVPRLDVPPPASKRESATHVVSAVTGSAYYPTPAPLAHGRKRIDSLLHGMVEAQASDLHLSADNPPVLRVHGEMQFARNKAAFTSSEIDALIREIMTEKARADWEELRDADFAYEVEGLARFRVNVFQDRKGTGAVLRQIPIEIKTAEELGLPKACLDLCYLSKGLVLVTGPTGSGKSTTLAAMIDHINKNRSDHIITIEDPVEFIHPNQKCLVNQREVGQNTKSFKNALRAALREDPDIVLVGEMRDLETISIAIETAETGHLVFGTLHTTTAVSTVDRIIDQFPTDRQAQIRVMLSESLKGVVAQGLCKKIGGGRVAAHEILLGTTAVSALVRDGKTFQIPSIMQTSKNMGMVTMNDSLFSLVQKKLVEPKEAYIKAVDKAGLLAMFKGANLPTSFTP